MEQCNTVLNKLRVLQKRALRIVLRSDNNIRSSELFHRLKVDPINLRWKKTNVLLLFKVIFFLFIISNLIQVQSIYVTQFIFSNTLAETKDRLFKT